MFNKLFYYIFVSTKTVKKMKRNYKLIGKASQFGTKIISAYSRQEAINTLVNNTSIKRNSIASCKLI